jgi:mitochondrial intermediate peptidase
MFQANSTIYRSFYAHKYATSSFRSLYSWNNSSKTPSTGLFGLKEIQTPTDFIQNAHKSIYYCNYLRSSISQTYDQVRQGVDATSLKPQMILRQLDAISNAVCNVIDVATCCSSIHSDEAYRLASAEARNILSAYIHELNDDYSLYAMICHIIRHHGHELSSEDLIFANDLKREYENDGIHLPVNRSKEYPHCRQDVVELKNLVSEAEDNLMKNATELDRKLISLGPVPSSDHANLRNLVNDLDPSSQRSVSQRSSDDDQHITCSSNKATCSRIITLIHQAHFRKQIWTQSYLEPSENRTVLGQLVHHRQHLADILGYPSYAHKYLAANHVLETPAKVISFLDMINQSIESKVSEEVEVLVNLKKELQRKDIYPKSTPTTDNQIHKLYPWDINYLTYMHREEYAKADADDSALAMIRPYLRLDIVLQGLQQICLQLFNLRFVQVSPTPMSEAWTKQPSLIHRFNVYRSDDQYIGTLFLDLFQRDQKFSGSGHFTLRCGCEVLDPTNKDEITTQAPMIALALSYPIYQHQANANSLPFLSLHQLETLYHEWGHALHSLLSKTKYQHLSGTRCPVDYAEVPSHLFEYYARSPEVIATWARHFISKEFVSKDLVIEAFAKKSLFRGLDVQGQVFYSAVDQEIFGEQMSFERIKALDQHPGKIYSLASYAARNMQAKYMPTVRLPDIAADDPYPLSSMSLLTHTHFIDYGGSYVHFNVKSA